MFKLNWKLLCIVIFSFSLASDYLQHLFLDNFPSDGRRIGLWWWLSDFSIYIYFTSIGLSHTTLSIISTRSIVTRSTLYKPHIHTHILNTTPFVQWALRVVRCMFMRVGCCCYIYIFIYFYTLISYTICRNQEPALHRICIYMIIDVCVYIYICF